MRPSLRKKTLWKVNGKLVTHEEGTKKLGPAFSFKSRDTCFEGQNCLRATRATVLGRSPSLLLCSDRDPRAPQHGSGSGLPIAWKDPEAAPHWKMGANQLLWVGDLGTMSRLPPSFWELASWHGIFPADAFKRWTYPTGECPATELALLMSHLFAEK